jgi:hypothetical protein
VHGIDARSLSLLARIWQVTLARVCPRRPPGGEETERQQTEPPSPGCRLDSGGQHPREDYMESIRRLTPPQLLVGAALLIVVGLAFAYLLDVGGNDDSSDVAGFVTVSIVAIAIAAFLVLWLVPREAGQAGAHRPGRTSLILGILAVLTLIGFWTALPFVLGVPALYLGAVGQDRARGGRDVTSPPGDRSVATAAETPSERTGGGEALAGTVLGAAALVLGLLLCTTG